MYKPFNIEKIFVNNVHDLGDGSCSVKIADASFFLKPGHNNNALWVSGNY